MVLLLVVGFSIATFISSATLRTSCAGILEDGWRFANHWLRLIIGAMVFWPMVMIAVALMSTRTIKVPSSPWVVAILVAVGTAVGLFSLLCLARVPGAQGRRVGSMGLVIATVFWGLAFLRGTEFTIFGGPNIVLWLAFVPIIAVALMALIVPPVLWFVEAGVNAAARGVEVFTESLERVVREVAFLHKAPIAVKLPRVPPVKKLLWPLAMFIIVQAVLGLLLSLPGVFNDPELLARLVLVAIIVGLLSFFNQFRGARRLLWVVVVVLTIIVCLGGRSEAKKSVAGQMSRLSGLFADPPDPKNYQRKVCKGFFGERIQLEDASDGVVAKFNEGCFGAYLTLPQNWAGWGGQPGQLEGEPEPDPDWWVAFWFEGEQDPTPAYTIQDLRIHPPNFSRRPGTFRLQGKAGESLQLYKIR